MTYRCTCPELCGKWDELIYKDKPYVGYVNSCPLARDIEAAIGDRIRKSDEAAIDLWGALANVSWFNYKERRKDGPYGDGSFGYSFRSAGALISEIQGKGCYTDWYCSGITSTVPEWIASALGELGWTYKLCDKVPPINYKTCNDGYEDSFPPFTED